MGCISGVLKIHYQHLSQQSRAEASEQMCRREELCKMDWRNSGNPELALTYNSAHEVLLLQKFCICKS